MTHDEKLRLGVPASTDEVNLVAAARRVGHARALQLIAVDRGAAAPEQPADTRVVGKLRGKLRGQLGQ